VTQAILLEQCDLSNVHSNSGISVPVKGVSVRPPDTAASSLLVVPAGVVVAVIGLAIKS
jgi:hypothetical protein